MSSVARRPALLTTVSLVVLVVAILAVVIVTTRSAMAQCLRDTLRSRATADVRLLIDAEASGSYGGDGVAPLQMLLVTLNSLLLCLAGMVATVLFVPQAMITARPFRSSLIRAFTCGSWWGDMPAQYLQILYIFGFALYVALTRRALQ